jgi:hypothetical protein
MKVIFFVNTGDTKMPRGGGKGKPTGKTVKHKVSKLANIVTKVVGGASGSTSRQPHSPPVASSPPRRQHTRRRLGSRPSAHKQVEAEVEEDAKEEVEEPRTSDYFHTDFLVTQLRSGRRRLGPLRRWRTTTLGRRLGPLMTMQTVDNG